MAKITRFLPSFKVTYIIVGITFVLMAGSILIRGVPASMEPFNLPEETLASPHYLDSMWWTYSHMVILGLIILFIGIFAQGPKLKIWMSRLLLLANAYYTFLDFRSSDSSLGNGLYEGDASLMPAFIALATTLLFLQLVIRDFISPPAS